MAWWLVQQLATVTLLIVVVHAISRLLSLGPVTRHALWAIVLVKLVTPPLVTWPWAVHADTRSAAAAQSMSVTANPGALFTMLVEAVSPDAPTSARSSPGATAQRQPKPSWSTLALIAWVTGSLVFGCVQLIRTIRLARLVRRSTAAPIDGLERLVTDVAATVGVRAVPVHVVDGLASPMVWAFWRLRLLWPADLAGLDADATRALLTHELAHIKRRDHWLGWLDLAAGIVWWWTPMYWHARRHIREHAEMACDAWAAESLNDNRRAYADALLALCASPSTPTLPASALGIHTEDRRFLERRLAVIMRPSTPLRLSRLGLCTVAIATCLALPAFAQRPAPMVVTPVEAGQQTVGVPVTVIPDGAVVPQAGARVQAPMVPGASVTSAAPVIVGYPPVAVATTQSLPAEAQALLNSYNEVAGQAQRETEERLARERAALIEKLQKLQDTETKAGHLDEAVAIRDRVRQLQLATRSQAAAGPSRQAFAALSGLRDRVGTTFDMEVAGSTLGTVWGSGVYTDDSSVPAAAVHAGVLKPGQVGTVHVTILPGQAQYAGSVANGVSSNDYGSWTGSFRFEGARTAGVPNGAQPPSPRSIGSVVTEITGALDGGVWGTDVYTDDSSVAAAAVHQGLLQPGETGTIEIIMLPGQERYVGSTRNGVKSTDWASYPRSFRLLRRVTPDPALPLGQTNRPVDSDVAELPPFHPEAARPGSGITNPVPLKMPKPVYTPEAMRAKIAGTVALDVLIDETGAVKDARVRKSLDDRYGLDQEALKAARQWTFRPARDRNNEPIPMVVVLELDFRLRPSPTGQLAPQSNLPPSAEQRYRQALSDFMSNSMDAAIAGFRGVIESAPGTGVAVDAQFQIAEAYYQQGKCAEAVPEYGKVVADSLRSPHAAEALYMQGLCSADLRRPDDARRMFQLVIDQYPTSTQALMAAQKLR